MLRAPLSDHLQFAEHMHDGRFLAQSDLAHLLTWLVRWACLTGLHPFHLLPLGTTTQPGALPTHPDPQHKHRFPDSCMCAGLRPSIFTGLGPYPSTHPGPKQFASLGFQHCTNPQAWSTSTLCQHTSLVPYTSSFPWPPAPEPKHVSPQACSAGLCLHCEFHRLWKASHPAE